MTGAGVIVASGGRSHAVPIDVVVELCERLELEPQPDGPTIGTASFRGEKLPVLSLGRLLHETGKAEDGGFLILETAGHRFALAVERIEGVTPLDAAPAILDLAPLIQGRLPAAEPHAPPPVETDTSRTRYLVAEIAGRRCAFPLDAVERVQDACRIVRAPSSDQSAIAGIAVIEGRILPVLDARALLGFGPCAPAGFVLASDAGLGRMIVAVDRVLGLQAIEDDALEAPPTALPVDAVARVEGQEIWVLSAARLIGAQ